MSASLSAQTRQRLLDAAGEVFAEHGLPGATVREICRRAGANIAAINYHFGDKRGLYSATFRHHYERGLTRYPPDMGVKPTDPPETRLHAFIGSFFLRIFAKGQPEWFAPLILREMLEPSGVLDELIDTHMHRMRELLVGLVKEIVGRRMSSRELFQACTSIVGQIVFHKHCNPVICRMFPSQRYSAGEVARLADHVWRFSVAGLRGMREAA